MEERECVGGDGGRGLEEWEEEHVWMGGEARGRRSMLNAHTNMEEDEEQERWWMEKKEQD